MGTTRLLGYVPKSITGGSSVVYFVQGSSGLIKIGLSTRLNRLMYDLMRANDRSVVLVGVMLGTVDVLRDIHGRFGEYRRHGEWFCPTDDLVVFIRENRYYRVKKVLETTQDVGLKRKEVNVEAVDLDLPVEGCDCESPEWTSPEVLVSKSFLRMGFLDGVQ